MKARSRVGLGTFPLAGVFSKLSKKEAAEIIKTFLNNGGFYIDTAPLYDFGEVEELLGEALKDYPRDDYYLVTKCGYIDVEGKTFQTVQKSGKYKDVIRECERSLRRLNLDYIDLYFVHSPDPDTPFDETVKALTKLQKEGKIREIGVSNVNLEELKEYNQTDKVKYIQNRFSLINRSIDEDFENYLSEYKIKLIPYQPIERSQLSDRALGQIKLREGDLRIGRSDWEHLQLKTITAWVKERLRPIAERLGVAIEQLTLAWELHQNYVGFVIVGATNTDQVLTNLKTNEIKLSTSVMEQIEKAYKELEKQIKEKHGQTIREFRGLNEKFY